MENKRRSSSDGGFHLRSVSPSAAQDEGGALREAARLRLRPTCREGATRDARDPVDSSLAPEHGPAPGSAGRPGQLAWPLQVKPHDVRHRANVADGM